MVLRILIVCALMAAPLRAYAAHYVVRPSDSLTSIAQRYHVSASTLARINGIVNRDLIRIGQVLTIPGLSSGSSGGSRLYRVQWGDTLSALAVRFGTTVTAIRSVNPSLGQYPLAGQWLHIPTFATASSSTVSGALDASPAASVVHIVAPGESLSVIAAMAGTTTYTLAALNHLTNPDHVVVGMRLIVPAGGSSRISTYTPYDPYLARSLIVQYAAYYGLPSTLPLAVAWQESGFNQNLVSSTGALGVMQVEPYTGVTISRLTGRQFNLHEVHDNIQAGVYWLSYLYSYYGGNQRLAIAAYYQGSRSIARRGLFDDTVQYVANVLALETRFSN